MDNPPAAARAGPAGRSQRGPTRGAEGGADGGLAFALSWIDARIGRSEQRPLIVLVVRPARRAGPDRANSMAGARVEARAFAELVERYRGTVLDGPDPLRWAVWGLDQIGPGEEAAALGCALAVARQGVGTAGLALARCRVEHHGERAARCAAGLPGLLAGAVRPSDGAAPLSLGRSFADLLAAREGYFSTAGGSATVGDPADPCSAPVHAQIVGSPEARASLTASERDLVARIDRLGALKPVAKLLAIAGPIEEVVLARMLEMDRRQVRQCIAALSAEGVVTASATGRSEETVDFQCAALRSAAYDMVPSQRRIELHRRCAEALRQTVGASGDGAAAALARHYAAAGDAQPAAAWWRRAAEIAIDRSDSDQAVANLRRAIDVLDGDAGPAAIRTRIDILRLLAPQLSSINGNADVEVVEAYQGCLDLAGRIDSDDASVGFDVFWGLSTCYLVRGEIREALDIGARLTAIAARAGCDRQRLLADRIQGLTCLLAGRLDEAQARYGAAIARYDVTRHAGLRFRYASDQGALSYAHRAWALVVAGDPTAAVRDGDAALALARQLDHPHTTAHVLSVLAAAAQTAGERGRAGVLATSAKRHAVAHGYRYWAAWADLILGWLAGTGQPGEGLATMARAIEDYQDTGARQALPYAFMLLAQVALDAGRAATAACAIEQAARLARSRGLRLYLPEIERLAVLAGIERGQGEAHLRRRLAQAEATAARQGAVLFCVRIRATAAGLGWSGMQAPPESADARHGMPDECESASRG